MRLFGDLHQAPRIRMNEVVVMCVTVRRALFEFDPLTKFNDALTRRIFDVKSEISRIFDVKYLTFLTSNGKDICEDEKGSPRVNSIITIRDPPLQKCACVCRVCCHPIYSGHQVCGRTSRGHTGGRSHMLSHPPSFCGACLNFSREKDSAVPAWVLTN